MDPITVFGATASVISIIDVLARCIGVIDNLSSQFKTADIAILSLTSQLRALSAALLKIQGWTESGVEEMHHQLVMDVKSSVDCCQMLASKIYEELIDLQKTSDGRLLSTAKAKFVLRRNGMSELQSMLDRQISTLTLLLTACNSNSLAQQQKILDETSVRNHIESVRRDTASLLCLADTASFSSEDTEKSSKLSLRFDFDEELFNSRPYKNMIRKTITFSIRSQKQQPPSGPREVITTTTSTAAGARAGAVSGRENTRDAGPQSPQEDQISEKVLLLGQGESSKTTFLKQLQFLYAHDISLEDRKMWRNIIYDNLTSTLQLIVRVLRRCGNDAEREPSPRMPFTGVLQTRVEQLCDTIDANIDEELPPDFPRIFRLLYNMSDFQTALHAGLVKDVPGNLQ